MGSSSPYTQTEASNEEYDYQYPVNENAPKTIETNKEVRSLTGYRTYVIFGLDHRSMNEELSGENSDTIIIVSINNDKGDIRMVSVYRDTLLDIGDDIYTKANAAYAYGGPVQAINMLNRNLDLKITDYVSVDFSAVTDLVDAVGGVDVPLSYAEMVHMNNYCIETSEETGKNYVPIELPSPIPEDQEAELGVYHLNGVQATSYCRIRYTASMDMGRTERQRRVIQLVTQKLKKAGVTGIFQIADQILPLVSTSLNITEILSMIPSMINYSLDKTKGFPIDYKFSNVGGDVIVADTLEKNVKKLHKFLYGKEEDYKPSDKVKEISKIILSLVGGESQLQDQQPQTTEQNESLIWTVSANSTDVSSSITYFDDTATPTPYVAQTESSTPSPSTEENPNTYVDTGGGDNQYTPDTGGTDNQYTPDTGGGDSQYTPDTGGGGNQYTPDTGGGDSQYTPDTGGGDSQYTPDTGGGDSQYTPDTGGGDYQYDVPDTGGDTGGDTNGGGSIEYFTDPGTGGDTGGDTSGEPLDIGIFDDPVSDLDDFGEDTSDTGVEE